MAYKYHRNVRLNAGVSTEDKLRAILPKPWEVVEQRGPRKLVPSSDDIVRVGVPSSVSDSEQELVRKLNDALADADLKAYPD